MCVERERERKRGRGVGGTDVKWGRTIGFESWRRAQKTRKYAFHEPKLTKRINAEILNIGLGSERFAEQEDKMNLICGNKGREWSEGVQGELR